MTLALAAVAVVAACFFSDLRLRPGGAKRDELRGVGLIGYAVLLDRAIGPGVDRRRGGRFR
ncbi:MAG TPA: hypothetical protein VKH46_00935 [Thermoanaerobaculia bacterium]|jgi:hypothetical protein|nr:hypothetical protein [Thermoanaerobaculia bacterium]